MKRFLLAGLFLTLVSFSMYAQGGVYFDMGVGLGGALSEVDGENAGDTFDGYGVRQTALNLGLKLGYGPIAGIPLYAVGVFEGAGHRFFDDSNYVQLNSYLAGPGLIFYPIPLIQIAGSLGVSWTGNDSSLPGTMYKNDGPGFAGDVSVAIDAGSGNHGALIGLRYFGSTNTLTSGAKQDISVITLFVKYAYRKPKVK
ncbi:hypothetical protein FACS189491_09790 [Spirochaetia bacterium]|nr:hypothetical protein FACS189491_09790 [Spirochaetia bacterium]